MKDADLIAQHVARYGVVRIEAHEGTAPDDSPADYELHIRIKNGRILAALRRARFGLDGAGPKTYSQTAKLIAPASYCGPGAGSGITKERVRQIEKKALRFLRHPSRSRSLRQFLPEVEQFDGKPLGRAP